MSFAFVFNLCAVVCLDRDIVEVFLGRSKICCLSLLMIPGSTEAVTRICDDDVVVVGASTLKVYDLRMLIRTCVPFHRLIISNLAITMPIHMTCSGFLGRSHSSFANSSLDVWAGLG